MTIGQLNNIQDLISGNGFIMVNKGLAKALGLVASTIYGELVSTNEYWKNRNQLTEHEGKQWFFCTIEDLEDKTTIKKDAQAKAIKLLEKEGLIETKRLGLPAKRYFHITDKYIRILTDNYFTEKPQSDNDSVYSNQTNQTNQTNTDEASDTNSFLENRKLDYCFPETNKKQFNNKQNNINNINTLIDDDKRETHSLIHNEENVNLIISNFRQATDGEITDRSFNAVVRKVMDKYTQGKVNSFRDYLATALISKIEELEFRRMKDKAKESLKESATKRKQERASQLYSDKLNHKVVFYNWLEQ